jgi:hypothetical protein
MPGILPFLGSAVASTVGGKVLESVMPGQKEEPPQDSDIQG